MERDNSEEFKEKQTKEIMFRRMVILLTSLVCFYCRETITLTFRDKQVTEILLMKSYYTRY